MADRKMIDSIEGVVAAFGGNSALARWAGVGEPAISNWIARESIPPGWHYRIDRYLRTCGYDVHPSVFGYDPEIFEAEHGGESDAPTRGTPPVPA